MDARVVIGVVIAIYGAVFGSFFNVVGMRVPRGESISTPPSHCDACRRRLGPMELIPVASWLWLRGRCKTCGARVSALYPVVEALTAVAFTAAWVRFGFAPQWFVTVFASSVFAVLSVSDILYRKLPDKVLLPAMGVMALLRLWSHPLGFQSYVAGAALGFALLYVIAVLVPGGMGFGDVKLFAFVGLFTGLAGTVLTLMLASTLGAVVGLLLRVSGRLKAKEPIPFGPAIGVAAVLAALYGGSWIHVYMHAVFR